jgi:hypothetical protein
VVVPGGISPVIIVVVAVLVIALIVILCNRKAETVIVLTPPVNVGAHFPTPPLESIRITKENFKPYIKTA